MFGVVRPCRRRLGRELYDLWRAHLCGLCLTLRDEHGQAARSATNVDGLLLSLLVEAQAAEPGTYRVAGPCPLRRMRTAVVATSAQPGTRYAAAISLVAAASRIEDHVLDGDGPLARRPVSAVARTFAGRFAAAGARAAAAIGFDTAVIARAAGEVRERESAARPGSPVLSVTRPTESATAAAFAHTAVLAGRPHNHVPLTEAGGMFGRLIHVLDAVADLRSDRALGAWNLLDATGTDLPRATLLCQDALAGLRAAVSALDLRKGRLVEALLVHETGRVVRRTFATAGVGITDPAVVALAAPGRHDRRREPTRPRNPPQEAPPCSLGCNVTVTQGDSSDGDCCGDCCDDCCEGCCEC